MENRWIKTCITSWIENWIISELLLLRFYLTNTEKSSKSWWIKPKSDCIYHFPMDLEPQKNFRLVQNQSHNGKYNLIWVWFSNIYPCPIYNVRQHNIRGFVLYFLLYYITIFSQYCITLWEPLHSSGNNYLKRWKGLLLEDEDKNIGTINWSRTKENTTTFYGKYRSKYFWKIFWKKLTSVFLRD